MRTLAWIACLAMLAAALMPSLAHARKAALGLPAGLFEICSAAGLRSLAIPDNGDSQPSQVSQTADCPFCLPHCQIGNALPPAPPALPLTVARHEVPPLYLRAPRPLFAWAAAGCRDPPRFA